MVVHECIWITQNELLQLIDADMPGRLCIDDMEERNYLVVTDLATIARLA
jgi:hypothetical protein